MTADSASSARTFELDLAAFEGPFDLLLTLVLKEELGLRDVEIAGIVAARRGTLATRNTRHFIDSGLPLVNPWEPKR